MSCNFAARNGVPYVLLEVNNFSQTKNFYPEKGGSTFLRNITKYFPICTASHSPPSVNLTQFKRWFPLLKLITSLVELCTENRMKCDTGKYGKVLLKYTVKYGNILLKCMVKYGKVSLKYTVKYGKVLLKYTV